MSKFSDVVVHASARMVVAVLMAAGLAACDRTPLPAPSAVTAASKTTRTGAIAAGGDARVAVAQVENPAPRTYTICPGPDATSQALTAFFDAREGDTIQFCEGRFSLSTGLILNNKRGITIKGAGKDRTVLNFAASDAAEGLNVSHADGIVMQGFTVEDTPGNSIRVFRSRFVTFRDIRASWSDYATCSPKLDAPNTCARHGAYGLYPVLCQHVLIEDSEAFGASDAGIYVGQTSDVIVRRTRAEYNVAGFEFENTYRAEFVDNVATRNTGGFLIFDLPGLAQYGEKNLVHGNRAYDNNFPNFAPAGNIVGSVPKGTGMLVLASDQLEIYDNEIADHDTMGIGIVNYGLIDANEADLRYDFYAEGVHIHGNRFRDNGGTIQLPSAERGAASLLPLLIKLKNHGRSAHIVWDGGIDTRNGCTQFPKDADGVPLNQPNPGETGRTEARVDERGRPNYGPKDPGPDCGGARYNAWKFTPAGDLRLPENGLCIEADNEFRSTRLLTSFATPFVNARLTSSDPAQLVRDLLKPASTSLAPHRCVLPARPAPTLQLPFVPDPANGDRRPSEAEVLAACAGGAAGEVNRAALAYNCPRLDHYGLFANPADPRANPVAGFEYDLNTQLFSDYSTKYRFLYLPEGQPASYRDRATHGVVATLDFPVGTVIAKTFAFRKGADENVVETRLLIRRQTATGPSWIGLPYIWRTQADGTRVAELSVAGGTAAVEYDYVDPDPEVLDASGARKRYVGSVPRYAIPAALSCVTCHGNDDREAGAAPIGPKPRNLNKVHRYPDGTEQNQLQFMAQRGHLVGLPADLARIERLPRFNVPGDAGDLPGSDADVHHRVRAYLEVNCVHCHSGGGAAANSGLLLDAFRPVDVRYGICKRPIAAGRGSGEGRRFDIVPRSTDTSILPFRVASAETGVKMPPVARSVPHGEAVSLINQWVDDVLPTADTEDNTCSGFLRR
jgi:parallel beta-helix repeat protein